MSEYTNEYYIENGRFEKYSSNDTGLPVWFKYVSKTQMPSYSEPTYTL